MGNLTDMRVVEDPTDLRDSAGGAFVATLGALHEGHLALMCRAKPLASPLVVSIFVNPTQFGPGEDYQRYPRRLDADVRDFWHSVKPREYAFSSIRSLRVSPS